MKIISIVDNDPINSLTGFTTTIYFSGCEHKCKGCFSKTTWNWNNGSNYSLEELQNIILLSKCKNVSILGGDIGFPLNREKGKQLIDWIKSNTDKKLYVWTGYTKEEFEKWFDISKIDYLITDKFEIDKRNLMILLRGSTNQRIFCKGIQKSDEQILKEIEG